jgi:DNA-binding phage protein
MATVSDPDKMRAELAEIGERRADHTAAGAKLVEDTRSAITRAKGALSMTEIARLVRLERTSMYHTYAP